MALHRLSATAHSPYRKALKTIQIVSNQTLRQIQSRHNVVVASVLLVLCAEYFQQATVKIPFRFCPQQVAPKHFRDILRKSVSENDLPQVRQSGLERLLIFTDAVSDRER